MELFDIKTGTKLELDVLNELNGEISKKLVSQFEVAVNDKVFIIAAPISEGVLFPVRIGWIICIFFIMKDEMYRMKAKISGRQKKGNIDFLKLELLSQIVKVQRRRFFRFEYSVPIMYRFVEPANESNKEDIPFEKTITRDLSGGGLSILLKEKPELGSLLECEAAFPDMGKVLFTGKVVRVVKSDYNKNYGYEAGVSFCHINSRDSEAIVKFIFLEQRKLRKKGLM